MENIKGAQNPHRRRNIMRDLRQSAYADVIREMPSDWVCNDEPRSDPVRQATLWHRALCTQCWHPLDTLCIQEAQNRCLQGKRMR